MELLISMHRNLVLKRSYNNHFISNKYYIIGILESRLYYCNAV